jgi:hypothetical protein
MYGNRRYYEWPMVGVKKGYIKKLIVSDNFAWQQATDDHLICRCRRGCDRVVVGLTTTCAINAYHH